MARTDVVAGNKIIASELLAAINEVSTEVDTLEAYVPVTVRKTSDQSVTNSTTLTDDSDLQFAPAINTVYKVTWDLLYSGTTANDGKIAITFPTGATCPWGFQGYDASLAFSSIAFDSTVASATSFNIGGSGAGNVLICRIIATVTMGSTAGSVKLQFAQASATAATSMTVRIGSTMTYHRIA